MRDSCLFIARALFVVACSSVVLALLGLPWESAIVMTYPNMKIIYAWHGGGEHGSG